MSKSNVAAEKGRITLEDREAIRKRELANAIAAVEANPSDVDAREHLTSVRNAHSRGLSMEERVTRCARGLDLLRQHKNVAKAVRALADELKITPRAAREIVTMALEDSRPEIEVARIDALAELDLLHEEVAADREAARKAGEYQAVAASARVSKEIVVERARLAGVASKIEVSRGFDAVSDADLPAPRYLAEHIAKPWLLRYIADNPGCLPTESEVADFVRAEAGLPPRDPPIAELPPANPGAIE